MAIFLVIPWAQALFTSYFFNNSKFAQGEFKTGISISFFYEVYLKAFVFLLAGAGIVAGNLFLLMAALGVGANPAMFQQIDPDTQKTLLMAMAPAIVMFYLLLIGVILIVKAFIHVTVSNYVYRQLKLDEVAGFSSHYSVVAFIKLQLVNIVLMVLTLGLAYPWIKVRLAEFTVEGLSFNTSIDLAEYTDQQLTKQNALGDELGEAFDADADVGLVF